MKDSSTTMSHERIEHLPFKNLRLILVMLLLAVCVIAACVFLGGLGGATKIFVICLLIMTLAICLDIASQIKVSVSIDSDGIVIKNTFPKYVVTLTWDKLQYGYYVYSSKGHEYLLLTSTKLSSERVKRVFSQETQIFAQMRKKRPNQDYACIYVESDYQNMIARIVKEHVTFENKSRNHLRNVDWK